MHEAVRTRLRAIDTRRMAAERFVDACRLICAAAHKACGGAVRAVLVHGSALKGGFFPHFSDFDAHIYLDHDLMEAPLTPRPETCVALQAQIGPLDPSAFAISQFQVFAVDADGLPSEWEAPSPGTYEVLYGELPVWPMTERSPRDRAVRRLADARLTAGDLLGSFQDKPDGRAAAAVVRLGGTIAKGLLPQAAIVCGAPADDIWRWPLSRLLLDSPLPQSLARKAIAFYFALDPWLETKADPARVRSLLLQVHDLLLALADCPA